MIRKILKRAKSKKGFTLIEIFFAFLLLITISILTLNAFSKRNLLNLDVTEVERDHFESMKVVAKSLSFNGTDDKYQINLTGYVPTIDLDNPDKLYLYDIYDEGSKDVNTFNNKFEVLNRYVMGENLIEVNRQGNLDNYKIYITLKSFRSAKYSTTVAPSLFAKKSSDIDTLGIFYPIPDKLYKNKHKDNSLNNFIVPKNKSDFEVETYEQNF